MDLQLSGYRALITGSTTGIGAAIAHRLAGEHVSVVVHGLEHDLGEHVVDQIRNAGGEAELIIGDLATNDGAAAVAQQAQANGPIDILVNNAATYKPRDWFDVSPDEWTATYNTNVASMVRLIHHVVPPMKQRGWGRIINMSSGLAISPRPPMPDYSASKAAILNLTVGLAKHLANTGITVNAVGVGLTRTDHIEDYFRSVGKDLGWSQNWEEIEPAIFRDFSTAPLHRLASPDEIATAVAFIASPLAAFMIGSNLRIDGGSTGTIG